MMKKMRNPAAATIAKKRKEDEQSIYINPLTDFGFKKLFCSDRRGAERLLALLRAYLPDKMEGVTTITFLPTELLGETENTKRVSFDIMVSPTTKSVSSWRCSAGSRHSLPTGSSRTTVGLSARMWSVETLSTKFRW